MLEFIKRELQKLNAQYGEIHLEKRLITSLVLSNGLIAYSRPKYTTHSSESIPPVPVKVYHPFLLKVYHFLSDFRNEFQ